MTTPFAVDERLILRSPHVDGDLPVIFRGNIDAMTAVVYDPESGGQFQTQVAWLRREGPDPNVRPAIVEGAMLDYLDELRASGVTNMFRAGSYLEDEFYLDRQEAKTVLTYWMRTFGDRHPGGR